MKRKTLFALLAALLATVLVFAGCVDEAAPTTLPSTEATTEAATAEPTTEPTTEPPTDPPTEAPTEPPITNPLTGETLDAPLENRIVGVTINNVKPALPHVGVQEADLYFEMFVNDYATRGLALFTDIDQVEQIGSVRSMRYNFTDIGVGYDAIICHSGGSDSVLSDAKNSGVAQMNIDTSSRSSYSFRDSGRRNSGYSWEHCLFVDGTGIYAKAQSSGFRTSMNQEKDYGLTFSAESGTANGENADTVSITFNHKGYTKNSTFSYDEASGKYLFSQYGLKMNDGGTGEGVSFKNVIAIVTSVTNKSASGNTYHVADLEGSGSGYLACNGKIVPITWHRAGPNATFSFTLADGTPADLGVGNSYIGICPTASTIGWE
ncbi:MAG: DUF3048 domain-containing protein [Oscillospiraceae bacterium]|nr:DUF3048 domain-containing protein [Oscillospiraceae bacterium]MBQ8239181.1 DUF3048 domain-containing protein [Oscillospiraceae bacterium]